MRASEIRRGQAVIIEGKLFVVTNADHNTPGNLRAKVQFKLRDVAKGTIQDKRVGATDDIETATLDRRNVEYLYSEPDGHVLMDLETYDQDTIPKEVFGNDILYLKPNTPLTAMFHNGKVVSYEMPKTVDLESGGHAADHQRCDGHQPAQGSQIGNRADRPRSRLYRDRRGHSNQHRDWRISEPGVI